MKRLVTTVLWDTRVQFRQGLYFAAAVVLGIWLVILWQVPPAAVSWLLPVALFIDMSVFGFYFMAGVLFLEKGEGVLHALVVTPMRPGEYLVAKVISITLIALAASVLLVIASVGWRVQWQWLLLGVILNSWFMALLGFTLAARHDAVNEFLIPSGLWTIPTQLPLLGYFSVWTGWPLYLIPTQASMILFEATLRPVPAWTILYAVGYLLLAGVVTTWLASRAFARFVVRAERRR